MNKNLVRAYFIRFGGSKQNGKSGLLDDSDVLFYNEHEWQRSSVVEQRTHKPLVGGSNPPAATFLFTHPHAAEKVTSKSTNSPLESILKQVEQLSQRKRDTLASAILPHALDTLDIDRIILERSTDNTKL